MRARGSRGGFLGGIRYSCRNPENDNPEKGLAEALQVGTKPAIGIAPQVEMAKECQTE